MREKLLLGVARRIVTPPVGCCLAGYAPDVIAEKVNDDLTVTAFAFEQSGRECREESRYPCGIQKDFINQHN